ncbi:MAG: hypothetical protein KBS64_04990 [Treponema sp.]|nr:hypothetical protein [Candidatus Treponema equi]
MTKQIQAELLVLFLVLLGSIRYVLISHTKKDSLSVVPLAGLIFSIFNIFVFDFSIREAVVFVFSLWATLWNFRSILRLLSDVVIDRYEVKLVLISTLNAFVAVFLIVAVVYFRPAKAEPQKMDVTETVTSYTGSHALGFNKVNGPFKVTNGTIWNFEANEKTIPGRTVVVFVPSKTADVDIYRIFLQKLAKNGYSVYSGDFWTDDCTWFGKIGDMKFMRRFLFLMTKLGKPEKYKELLETEKRTVVEEYRTLIKLADVKSEDQLFILADEDTGKALEGVRDLFGDRITGSFDLAFLDDYGTKGFGPVENTDPLIAKYLGAEVDRSGYLSSHLAMEVTDFISKQQLGLE